MSNLINKVKSLTLEQINKNLVLFALLALIYRMGNFYNTFVPKPFEIILIFIILLTFLDLVIHEKFKDFFFSIDKKIWVALSCLTASVLMGWGVAIFIKNIPVTFNVILEFGNFVISLVIFILILFYAKNDELYQKKYLYALILPVVYIIFVIFPSLADYLYLTNDGTFLGLTLNPNIISKILLIPSLFYATYSLFKFDNKWIKISYVSFSSLLVALVFWVSSRGGLVALALSFVFLCIVYSAHNFSWKKLFHSGGILLMIFIIGFLITPGSGKQRVILRTLYPSGSDYSSYVSVEDKSATQIVQKFITDDAGAPTFIYPERETRFKIWPFYLKYIITNPLGIGPNTHFSFYLTDNNGKYINSGPHNTFLQIWLWGGILGILSFLYIFLNVIKHLREKFKSNFNPTTLALSVILFGVSVSIMFDDSLSFYWFFIILALSLRHENTTS